MEKENTVIKDPNEGLLLEAQVLFYLASLMSASLFILGITTSCIIIPIEKKRRNNIFVWIIIPLLNIPFPLLYCCGH